jgi:hypothetical protein
MEKNNLAEEKDISGNLMKRKRNREGKKENDKSSLEKQQYSEIISSKGIINLNIIKI